MLESHKENGAEVTIAVMPVSLEEATRFGIMITDEDGRITDFEEKPAHPRSTLASMGIYIFNWETLKEALLANRDEAGLDFGKHVIPYCREKGAPLYAYEFNGYWKDVGTLTSYWEANMELIDIVPEFNLYEEYWKIYTKSTSITPQFFGPESVIERTIAGEGTEIYGKVYSSVIGCDVTVGAGSVIRNSIIMNGAVIGEGCVLDKVICAENSVIGDGAVLGEGEEVPNDTRPDIYCEGLVTIGENTEIPAGVRIGKNVMISGRTTPEDYPGGQLASGRTLEKEVKA